MSDWRRRSQRFSAILATTLVVGACAQSSPREAGPRPDATSDGSADGGTRDGGRTSIDECAITCPAGLTADSEPVVAGVTCSRKYKGAAEVIADARRCASYRTTVTLCDGELLSIHLASEFEDSEAWYFVDGAVVSVLEASDCNCGPCTFVWFYGEPPRCDGLSVQCDPCDPDDETAECDPFRPDNPNDAGF